MAFSRTCCILLAFWPIMFRWMSCIEGFQISPPFISAPRMSCRKSVFIETGASVTSSHFATILLASPPSRKRRNAYTNNSFLDRLDTPLDRPVLAAVDVAALLAFASVGKASHSASGDVDIFTTIGVALPFWTAWLATSPLTGVYRPNVLVPGDDVWSTTLLPLLPGWAVAVPLGCVLRGVMKGYAPPASFVIVTMLVTLVLLTVARAVFRTIEGRSIR